MSRMQELIREHSTWRGLGLALSLAGVQIGPELAQLLGTLAIAVLALWELVRRSYGQERH